MLLFVVGQGNGNTQPEIDNGIIVFHTKETECAENPDPVGFPGACDLNGDGDTEDLVIRYFDTATGILSNTGVEGRDASIDVH